MAVQTYKYIIVGAGLAGASAAKEIRQNNKDASILLVGSETALAYHRPPLSKKLWFGQKKLEDIFVYSQQYYDSNAIQVLTGTKIAAVDASTKMLTDSSGKNYFFEKLLLATGGEPRQLPIPGGSLEDICYFRNIDDYTRLKAQATEGKSATVIGGGFIGSEIAAALNVNKVNVTMIFSAAYLCDRVFPNYLGTVMKQHYIDRGIKILSGHRPVSISKQAGRFVTTTDKGQKIESDMLIAGIGIVPEVKVAQSAGLLVENGIVVNEYLQTSHPDIYAAGDNAQFQYQALGRQMRVEHWDNALNQGKTAGRNMAGVREQYTYMPYFFSDLFEFGYEAVGQVESSLETFADWQKENDTGVIYYLKDHTVCGVMLCNVWEKVGMARDLIRKKQQVSPESLQGAVS
jgi:3-phenylpropionate/trans-cinnamate dioxygenase ferredoxin reductase component